MKAKTAEKLTVGDTFMFARRDATEWQIGSWDEGMQRFRVFNTAKPSEYGYISRDRVVWTGN